MDAAAVAFGISADEAAKALHRGYAVQHPATHDVHYLAFAKVEGNVYSRWAVGAGGHVRAGGLRARPPAAVADEPQVPRVPDAARSARGPSALARGRPDRVPRTGA